MSERLKHHRDEKGWSQEQLAERACIHRTYLAGIEAARRKRAGRDTLHAVRAERVNAAPIPSCLSSATIASIVLW
ncbi:MAG: helix-turn-helix transcriptional regulator [Acidobacteria bacterium]|nr:helix-turn-helix transcriptional regulator [Acidobacteriota bacterium]